MTSAGAPVCLEMYEQTLAAGRTGLATRAEGKYDDERRDARLDSIRET